MILLKAVYPRWRGEHTIVRFNNNDRSGLSPLARGTQEVIRFNPYALRFIPAGAGNTVPKSSHTGASTVYPRWRGEHKKTSVRLLYPIGLSPLARGTRKKHGAALVLRWFIPAGAGNTQWVISLLRNCAVYPRWRGEHCSTWRIWRTLSGLSPLARGTR